MPDPRITGLPKWLRLQATKHADMDPAEIEHVSRFAAATSHIERLRAENAALVDALRPFLTEEGDVTPAQLHHARELVEAHDG